MYNWKYSSLTQICLSTWPVMSHLCHNSYLKAERDCQLREPFNPWVVRPNVIFLSLLKELSQLTKQTFRYTLAVTVFVFIGLSVARVRGKIFPISQSFISINALSLLRKLYFGLYFSFLCGGRGVNSYTWWENGKRRKTRTDKVIT